MLPDETLNEKAAELMLTRPELMLQVHAKHMHAPWGGGRESLEFSGEVRLGSGQGSRLKGAPAVFVGESVGRNPGLWVANCAHGRF